MKNSAAPSTNHDQIDSTVRAGFELAVDGTRRAV